MGKKTYIWEYAETKKFTSHIQYRLVYMPDKKDSKLGERHKWVALNKLRQMHKDGTLGFKGQTPPKAIARLLVDDFKTREPRKPRGPKDTPIKKAAEPLPSPDEEFKKVQRNNWTKIEPDKPKYNLPDMVSYGLPNYVDY